MMLKIKNSRALVYGLSILAVALAMLVTSFLPEQSHQNLFLLFFAAVVIAAWSGGPGPALLAIILSSLVIELFFVDPRHTLDWNFIDTERLGIFVLVGLLISLLSVSRKRAQDQLDQFFALSLDMLCTAGFDGKFRRLNPSWEEKLGWSCEELKAKPYIEFIHPDDREATIAEAQKLANGTDTVAFENRYQCKDGSYKWLLWTATPFTGQQIIYAIARDISERKRAEESLRTAKDDLEIQVSARTAQFFVANESLRAELAERKRAEEALVKAEQRYRSMIHNAPYGIYLATPEGKFLDVNPALVEILHYESSEELMGINKRSLYCDLRDSARELELYRQDGRIHGVVVNWRRKDGKPVSLRLSGRAVHNDQSDVEALEVMVEDVTERKSLEDQLRQAQKMEAVGRLAGGVAHDFNNLLTAIIGYSELLLEQVGSDQKVRRELGEIRDAGKRAAMLTGQLLAFSRKQLLQPTVLDLNESMISIERMLRRLIGEDIDMITLSGSNLGRIKADPGQIEQILMNLAVNARDAMPDGGKLTIETANVDLDEAYTQTHAEVTPGRYVLLAVSDTGHGMDPETQSHIFEPFFTTKQQGKGTGLGLSTVYGIVKQSGGHIWVYSEPGHGVMFKIYFPAVDEVVESANAQPEAVESLDGTETIMLVEDDEAVRNLARVALERFGYTVLAADRGAHALEAFGPLTTAIDLVITDVIMPEMSGRVLVTQLQELHPEVKVLYVSGYTEEATIHHGVLHDGVAFLQKPFTPYGLARKVREVLAPAVSD